MIDTNSAKKRIDQLINLDEQSDKTLKDQYINAMDYIKQHLYVFYNAYSDENGLSITQTAQIVNNWDIKQWKQALDSTNIGSLSKEAQDRAKILSSQAGINKTNMINAIIGLGLLKLTDNQINTISQRINDDKLGQIKILGKELGLSPAQLNVLNNSDDDSEWIDTFWLASDGIRNNVENTINNSLRQGITEIVLGTLFALHASNKDKRPNKSIADRIHQLFSSARGNMRTQSSINVNKTNTKAYKMKKINKTLWVTEPGHCNLCGSIERGNPYLVDVAPVPGRDSHINCRCMLVPLYPKDYEN